LLFAEYLRLIVKGEESGGAERSFLKPAQSEQYQQYAHHKLQCI
jgi:hypothetical protein